MSVCPCCNGNGRIDDLGLTRMQKQVFEAVAKRPRTSLELADIIYADREDGGPEHGSRVIWSLVSQINKKIAHQGIKLRAGSHRAGSEPYRIVRL